MVFLPHFPKTFSNNFSKDSAQKIRHILAKMNNPQKKMAPVIHIAGTNGKGSTLAFLESILRSKNLKINSYISPHIHHVNERIRINGRTISDDYLFTLLEEVRFYCENDNLSLFEATTLATILAFLQNQSDYCLIETGMGGRVDATNALDNKIATILTNISFDHQEYLGNSLKEIAAEKIKITRRDIPCICAPSPAPILDFIKEFLQKNTIPSLIFGEDFAIKINDDESFNFSSQKINYQNLSKPKLPGWHQYVNASLAIAAANSFSDLTKEEINLGLENVNWPSRLEKLNCNLLGKEDEIYIDAAHNLEGMKIISDFLKEKIVDDYQANKPKRNYLIVGFSENKATPLFFRPFSEMIDFICPIKVMGEPKSESSAKINEIIKESGINETQSANSLNQAIKFLKNLDSQNPCRIVICGSIYLARDFKNL